MATIKTNIQTLRMKPKALTDVVSPMVPETGIFSFQDKKRYGEDYLPFFFSPQLGVTTNDVAPATLWTVPIRSTWAYNFNNLRLYQWNETRLKYDDNSNTFRYNIQARYLCPDYQYGKLIPFEYSH